MKTIRRFGFSPGTLDKALHDLAVGKPLAQYNLPEQVRHSIELTRYSERDINDAFAMVSQSERVIVL